MAADPKIDAMVAKAIEYLAKTQSADGAFSPQAGIGVTALVTTGTAAKRPLAGRSAGGPQLEVPGKRGPARRRHL